MTTWSNAVNNDFSVTANSRVKSGVSLNPQQIIIDLIKLVAGRAVCVAYSGGVDSHVMLHLLATTRHPQLPAVRALHIDHGLHSESSGWTEHCRQVAADLNIDFESIQVSVEDIDEMGMEAAARKARYHAFRYDLAPDEVLLTAQHQDDQAETLMLQLLRGAGPTGLSAMWPEDELEGLTIVRPFLGLPKTDLLEYAELHQLHWIDDPSNADLSISRNYLRHVIWPRLNKRWPAVSKTLSRSAEHCREAVELMRELASLDARHVCPERSDRLSIAALSQLPQARQRNLLRYALEQNGLTLPSAAILQRIIDEVIPAAEDRMPEVHWPGAMVRRYRDVIYLAADRAEALDLGELEISGTDTVRLPDGRMLKWQLESGKGLKQHVLNGHLLLKFREGGERIRLQGHAQHKALKQLFQEWDVPPWQRPHIPLLFVDHELVAVVGYGYAEHYAADIGEKGWLPVLEHASDKPVFD
ncbi:tRNA lysidine(34) synthetase TilS [Methylophaga sp.]|uniref:tRNA lysidine(34) synthetase TilS n=1 Tax=Methylophaga sp. TaxID=2024840 RepID=UPI0025E6FAA3|nr:tRNA lysidine(34) synthetase TilS [Methylophaga sp.]